MDKGERENENEEKENEEEAEGRVEVDETLYSRQLFVYGDVASRKMATASVLICGLGGLGVEIAKNVILTGVREVVLHDQEVATWGDLATQFYLTEEDLGKNRAQACVGRLAELNPYVRVTTTADDTTTTIPAATTTSTTNKDTVGAISVDLITDTGTTTDDDDDDDGGEGTTTTATTITKKEAITTTTDTTTSTTTTDSTTDRHTNNTDGKVAEDSTSTTDPAAMNHLTLEFIKKFTVVVLTDSPLEEQIRVDAACRMLGVVLVVGSAKGLCGQVFCDFGDEFYVADPSDRELATFPIMDITTEAEGIVSLPSGTFHGLRDGDLITFTGIRGMTALNHTTCPVKVLDGWRVRIGNTVGLGEYEGGGVGREVRQGRTFTHQSLSCALPHPTIMPMDPGKPSRGPLLHLAFLALHRYQAAHGAPPRPWHHHDAEAFFALCQELRGEGLGEDDEGEAGTELAPGQEERLLRLFSYTAAGAVAGLDSVVGGVVAGEVVKACARRFSPLTQFLYFDALECLPQEGLEGMMGGAVGCEGSRYEGLAGVVGQGVVEQLKGLQVLVVGAGAVGCELVKCLALLGVGAGQDGTGQDGAITLTDPDLVERSNLARQFLFRPWHVRWHKADVAAAGARAINPEVQVVPLQLRAGRDSGHVLDAAFYERQHAVVAAVDSAEARRHLDTWCRMAGVPLVEAGTHGTLGSVTVVVPHLTERYTTQEAAPHSSAPSCTLRNFPSTTEHLVQWARYLLQEEFSFIPTLASRYLTSDLTLAQLEQEGRAVVAGVRGTFLGKLESYEDCVSWAGRRLTHHHHTDILNLLQHFPPDLTTAEGHRFWSGVRRCPCPTPLDPLDPLHLTYVHAAANLQARVYGLSGEQNPGRTLALLSKMVGQGEHEEAREEIPPPSALPSLALAPLELEKDDTLQLDYMVAAAQLRGVNYHIPPGDPLSLRGAAGRVTPAVVTSSAVVAGLASLELLKVTQRHSNIHLYRIAEFNLALGRYCLLPPEPPPTYTYNGIEWTDWDRFDMEGDLTLQDFVDYFHRHHDLQLTMVASGNLTVHSFLLPAPEIERRMAMRLSEILRKLMEHKARQKEREAGGGKEMVKVGPVIMLDICANDRHGKDIEVPFVRYVVRKEEPATHGGGSCRE